MSVLSEFPGKVLGRVRRLRGFALPIAFGFVVYLVSLVLFFPYGRIKEQVVAMLAMQNLDAEIEEAGPTLGVGVSLSNIKIATRPTDGSKPSRFTIDSARVTMSPLASLRGEEAYDLSADAFGGKLDVSYEAAPKRSAMTVAAKEIAMAELPGVREAINLPLAGTLELGIDLDLPTNRYGEAGGEIHWSCAKCAIGDGKSKLKIASNPLLAEGISVPRIDLGQLEGRVVVTKGVGRLQGVHAKGADAEIFVEGEVRLSDPPAMSYLDAYVRFKLSDALQKKDDKIQLLLQLAEGSGKRSDGFYGFRLTGPLSRLRPPEWSKTAPTWSTPSSGGPGGAPRPNRRPRAGG